MRTVFVNHIRIVDEMKFFSRLIELRRRHNTYRYQPLPEIDSIRLLELRPGKEKEPISCRLFITNLRDAPPYEAISYVWGDPELCNTIACSGKKLLVTANLLWALKRIRSSSESVTLWADQICIHQGSATEQSHQVRQMGAIYKKAEQVYVCLGDCVPQDARAAISVVQELYNMVTQLTEQYGSFACIPTVKLDQVESYRSLDWRAYDRMITCTWFRRGWVVQEVGLARHATILYRPCQIEWHMLANADAWFSRMGPLLRYHFGLSAGKIYRAWMSFDPKSRQLDSTRHQPYTFLQIIDWSADVLHFSDPRDFIYGFLGYPGADEKGSSHNLTPDYELSIHDIYLDFAFTSLETSRQSDLLSYVYHDSLPVSVVSEIELPSWCPQWDNRKRKAPLVIAKPYQYTWYSASEGSIFNLRKLEHNKLQLSGFLLDVVSEKSDRMSNGNILRTQRVKEGKKLIMPSWLRRLKERNNVEALAYENVLHAFAITATAGRHRRARKAVDNLQCLPKDFSAYLRSGVEASLPSDVQNILHELPDPGDGKAEKFEHFALMTCQRRCFFITQKGYIGVGPIAMEEGDVCCVIFGAKVPFILRPLPDSTYYLVGECYLHGIMEGEAMKMLECGEVTAQSFVIR